MNAYDTLTDTDIQMSKVVVGIQLFPNKVNELEPLTYEEVSLLTQVLRTTFIFFIIKTFRF